MSLWWQTMNYVHLKTLSTSTRSTKQVYFTIWPHTGLTVSTGCLFWWGFVWVMLTIKTILLVSLKLPFLPIFPFGWFLQQYQYMYFVCNFFSFVCNFFSLIFFSLNSSSSSHSSSKSNSFSSSKILSLFFHLVSSFLSQSGLCYISYHSCFCFLLAIYFSFIHWNRINFSFFSTSLLHTFFLNLFTIPLFLSFSSPPGFLMMMNRVNQPFGAQKTKFGARKTI